MLGYAGATTSFPVIARDRDGPTTAAWLASSPTAGDVADIPIPAERGALVRNLAVDPRSGAVWLAYGASTGIPGRVARAMVR
jgi:hypothetical protein